MRSLTKTRRSPARALRRCLRQHLGDLAGFPLRGERGLSWMSTGPGPWRLQSLNRERLLQWRRRLSWLRRRFPRAIESELGEEWFPQQLRRLRRLRRLLDQEASGLGDPLALELCLSFLGLRREPRQVEQAKALERAIDEDKGRLLALKLLVWCDEAPSTVDRLLAVFGDEELWRTPIAEGEVLARLRASLGRWRSLAPTHAPVIRPIAERPARRFPMKKAALELFDLDELSLEQRRVVLEWAAAAFPEAPIRAWARWWRGFEELQRQAIRWARERRKHQPLRLRWHLIDRRVAAYGGRKPKSVPADKSSQSSAFARKVAQLGLAEPGSVILRSLRDRPDVLRYFFRAWRYELEDRERGDRRLFESWAQLAALLKGLASRREVGIKKFEEAIDLMQLIAEDARFGARDARRMRTLIERRLAQRVKADYLFGNWAQHYLAEHCIAAGRPLDQVLAWIGDREGDTGPVLSRAMVRFLLELAGDDRGLASALLDARPPDWDDDFLKALEAVLRHQRSARLLRALILGRHHQELAELRRAIGDFKVSGSDPRGLLFSLRARSHRYEGLRSPSPALRRAFERALAWADGSGLQKILGPDRGALRSELAAMARLLRGELQPGRRARILIRQGRLRLRLREGDRLSPQEESRRIEKLEAARLRGMARAWIAGIRSAAQLAEEARPPALVSELGFLERRYRGLARRLVKARRDPGWDGRAHPRNAAFLRRMEGLGLNMEAWLAPPVRRARTPDGRSLTLKLEGDPLAILEMGAAFETCLAPGGANFFSVLSNAWDINKRVLYAREPGGKIFARSLIGMTRDGGVLTYRLYAHEEQTELLGIFAGYLVDLCRALGSIPVPRGKVDRLVADEWYDDGSELYCRHALDFDRGSEWQMELRRSEAAERPALVRKALRPLAPTPLRRRILEGALEDPTLLAHWPDQVAL